VVMVVDKYIGVEGYSCKERVSRKPEFVTDDEVRYIIKELRSL